MATYQKQPRATISGSSAGLWIPPGQSVVIQGKTIPGGMLYLGEKLWAVARSIAEPALINPRLAINAKHPDDGRISWMYWPSYSMITREARAGYLDWLASGRGAGASIGYVLLFFYGIERRVFHDALRDDEAKHKLPLLIAEVQRLWALYRHDYTFNITASLFLSAAKRLHDIPTADDIEPPMSSPGWELPLELKLVLGSFVAKREPIPAVWALSWLRCHPDTKLRTPAQRCAKEFNELFQVYYRREFGDGLLVKRNKKPLEVRYRPANPGFVGEIDLPIGDLPDVSRVIAPMRQLWYLAAQTELALDPYSRHLALHPESKRTDLWALSNLPPELLAGRETDAVKRLASFLDRTLGTAEIVELDAKQLLGYWQPIESEPSKRDAVPLTRLLASLGYGIEPDPRQSSENFVQTGRCVLFRSDLTNQPLSAGFARAKLKVQTGVALALVDGPLTSEQEAAILDGAGSDPDLTGSERRRLRAAFRWQLGLPPRPITVRALAQSIAERERAEIATFLVRVAAADGRVSAKEIAALSRVYPQLGLPIERLHADVHAAVTGAGNLTTIAPAERGAGFTIPKAQPAGAVLLDRTKVTEVQRSTRVAEALLSQVFAGSGEADEVWPSPSPVINTNDAGSGNGTFDPAHAALLRALSGQETWSRSELARLANEAGLMLGGAIETLNEASFALCDEPLLEDEDPIEVNRDALGRMLQHVG